MWTVNAKDVEWITVELKDNPDEINKILDEIEKIKTNNNIDTETKRNRIEKLETKLLQIRKQRQFKIKPEKRTVTINLKVSRGSHIQNKYTYQMLVFPVNICTAATGHKLQSQSKDILIISSWPKLQGKAAFVNWEYVMLSRVRTLEGLYIFEKLDYNRSYTVRRAQSIHKKGRKKEENLIRNRERAIKQLIG